MGAQTANARTASSSRRARIPLVHTWPAGRSRWCKDLHHLDLHRLLLLLPLPLVPSCCLCCRHLPLLLRRLVLWTAQRLLQAPAAAHAGPVHLAAALRQVERCLCRRCCCSTAYSCCHCCSSSCGCCLCTLLLLLVVAEASAMTCDWLQEAAPAASRHALSLRWGRCHLHGRGLGILSSRGSTAASAGQHTGQDRS